MTREEFAAKVHWNKIIFAIGIVNALAVVPQLIQLWQTRVTDGLSITMLFLFLFVQIGFTLHGYLIHDRALFYTIGLSTIISILTILSALYLRSFSL